MNLSAGWLGVLVLVTFACGDGAVDTAAPPVATSTVERFSDRIVCPVDAELPAIPPQPVGVPYPTRTWPEGPVADHVSPARVEALTDAAIQDESDPWGRVQAVLVVHQGKLVWEEYGRGFESDEQHQSFSIAKTVLHAAYGIAARDGLIDPTGPIAASEWAESGDPRQLITATMLLAMTSGLEWEEDGFGMATLLSSLEEGNAGATQALRSPVAPPGEVFLYSSGSSALAARTLSDAIGPGRFDEWLREMLFEPIGIGQVELVHDADGYWMGGLGANMTARDYARLGLLYLRGGLWDGEQVVPSAWVDAGRVANGATCVYGVGLSVNAYGDGSYSAEGFLGQNIIMIPEEDLVVVVLAGEFEGTLVDAFSNELIDLFRR